MYLPVDTKMFTNTCNPFTNRSDVRFEKATVPQFQWLLDLLAAGLPGIKEKFHLLHPMAQHLTAHDHLDDFGELSIKSDEWRKGERDFIRDGLSTITRRLSRSPRSSPSIQVPSTYPEPRSSQSGRTSAVPQARGRYFGVGHRPVFHRG